MVIPVAAVFWSWREQEAVAVLVAVEVLPLGEESQPVSEATESPQPVRPVVGLAPAPEASGSAGWGLWPDSGR